MIRVIELVAGLWLFGVPAIALTWSALRLTANANPRLRYAIAVTGYVGALLFPLSVHVTRNNPFFTPSRSTSAVASVEGVASTVRWNLESLALAVAAVWFLVAIVLVAREVIGHIRLTRARHESFPAPATLRELLQWPESRDLLLAADQQPRTIGLWQPAVVLPANIAERFSTATARGIAFHELSHLQWRDPLVYGLLRFATALCWPSPVWTMLRWVRREREAAADAVALRRTAGDEASYVEALLEFSKTPAQTPLAATMAGSDLRYRALRILSPAPSRFSVLAIIALLAAVRIVTASPPLDLSIPPSASPVMRTPIAATQSSRPAALPAVALPARAKRHRKTIGMAVAQTLPLRSVAGLSVAPAPPGEPAPTSVSVHRDAHGDVDVHRDIHIPDPGGADRRVITIRSVIRKPPSSFWRSLFKRTPPS